MGLIKEDFEKWAYANYLDNHLYDARSSSNEQIDVISTAIEEYLTQKAKSINPNIKLSTIRMTPNINDDTDNDDEDWGEDEEDDDDEDLDIDNVIPDGYNASDYNVYLKDIWEWVKRNNV